MAWEVERKFLLDSDQDTWSTNGSLEIIDVQGIEQTYLALAEGEELRIRKMTKRLNGQTTYMLTYKNGYGLVRREVEQEITEQLYVELMSKVRLKPLLKERTTARVVSTGIIVEIDRYYHKTLTVVEVEFANEEEAMRFQPPEWFGPEVSFDKRYSNKELWKHLQT